MPARARWPGARLPMLRVEPPMDRVDEPMDLMEPERACCTTRGVRWPEMGLALPSESCPLASAAASAAAALAAARAASCFSTACETLINFTSDESGTIYEYRFIDTEIDPEDGEDPIYRNWTIIKPPLDFLEWLPGSVWQFQVRAIDPAGNYDPVFEEGRNQWTWRYIPALPWGLIIGLTLLGLALIGAGYFEYRRRRRKKMMERSTTLPKLSKLSSIPINQSGSRFETQQTATCTIPNHVKHWRCGCSTRQACLEAACCA